MVSTRPGPKSINFAYTGATFHDIGDMWSRRDMLVDLHAEHKERVDQVTHVANGEWYHVWPSLTNTPEAPTVANVIEMGINHWSAIGGAVLPSVRVPVDMSDKNTQAKRGARKRERRLREIISYSQLADLASSFWGDYAGTGSAIMGAWCDFHLPPEQRNPYVVRYDPRHTYPTLDEKGNVTELLVARMISKVEASARYPELKDAFKNTEGDLEEWHWYTHEKFYHVFADVSKQGREKQRHYVVAEADNPLGFVPAVEVVRPSFDSQRRGVFDQTLHILRTMHRLMTLTIAATEEDVFPPLVEYDTINPEDFGPGGTVSLRSAEGRIERVGASSRFDVKDLIARMGDEANRQSAWPQQLTGDPGASIASARAITASMGQLDSRLALAHRQFEIGFGKVFGFLLAMDETFCNVERTIVGDHRDAGNKAESWFPERDINGAWYAEATYGIGAGADPANIEMRLSMHQSNGTISLQTAREQLPFLEDPDREAILVLREQMQQALLAGILEKAGQGDPTAAAEALKLMNTDDVQIGEVIEKLVEFLTAPPEQEAGPGGGAGDPALAAIQGAESMARGGIPGQAEQAPDPATAQLPPLGQLMGQDARLVS